MIQQRALPLHLSGWLLKAALLFSLLLLPIAQVSAAIIEVSDDCSLHDAIKAANDNSNTHNTDCTAGSGADIITLSSNETLSGELVVSSVITIEGNGRTISGAGSHRIFRIPGGGNLTINRLTMIKGRGANNGGCVRIDGGIRLHVKDSVLRDCFTLFSGGAIYSVSSTNGVKIEGTRFINNTATGNGGALYHRLIPGTLEVLNSVFIGNKANGTPHGAGALFLNETDGAVIKNSIFRGNEASQAGGGIVSRRSHLTMENSVIYNNVAGTNGGGLGLWTNAGNATTTIIRNSVFYGNSASGNGGGIYAGYEDRDINATLQHVTIVNNKSGGGLWNDNSNNTVRLRNSLLAGNAGGDCGVASGASIAIAGSLIQDGSCSATLSGNARVTGSGQLLANSPAINAGATSHCLDTDLRGKPRDRAACDIGAYEGFITPPPEPEPSDGLPYLTPTPSTRLAAPPPETCNTLPDSIIVSAPTGKPQCQQVGDRGIGIASVIERGIIDAVDVWSWLGAGAEVCFRQSSGTVVLVPGPPLPAATDTPPSYQSLSDCMVYTQYALNFRDAPDGKLIRVLPFNVTLTALQRTSGWFKVDYYGAQGWISARFVEPKGDCG